MKQNGNLSSETNFAAEIQAFLEVFCINGGRKAQLPLMTGKKNSSET